MVDKPKQEESWSIDADRLIWEATWTERLMGSTERGIISGFLAFFRRARSCLVCMGGVGTK